MAENDKVFSSISNDHRPSEEEEEEEEDKPRKKHCYLIVQHDNSYSIFQRRELEKAFKKNPYPTKKMRETLAENTGLSITEIKFWFVNQRCRKAQKNYQVNSKQYVACVNETNQPREVGMADNPGPSQVQQTNQQIKFEMDENCQQINQADHQLTEGDMGESFSHINQADQSTNNQSSSCSSVNLTTDKIMQKLVKLRSKLDFERKQSAQLRFEHHKLVTNYDKVVQELEEERLKNNHLNEKVETLTQKLIECERFKRMIDIALRM